MGSFIAKPGVRLVSDSGPASRPQCKPSAASGLVYACTFSCALGGIGFFDDGLVLTLPAVAEPLDDHDAHTVCHGDHAHC